MLARNAAWLVAGTLALAATPSRADELLLMPFSCAMIGGEAVLTRSGDEGHRIIGPREQRPFTACSPANPANCRHWTVQRFDIDCGGARVPWLAIATAAARQRNVRAWTANGHLTLQMPPRWNMAADDPCARGWNYDERWRFDRLARYCADRRMLAPAAIVEMPPGFAPLFGIGVFVGAAGAATAPPVAAGPGPQPARSELAKPPPGEPRADAREAAAKATPAKKQFAPKTERGPSTGAAPPPTAASPIVPRIINRADPSGPPASPPPAVAGVPTLPAGHPAPAKDVAEQSVAPQSAATPPQASPPEHLPIHAPVPLVPVPVPVPAPPQPGPEPLSPQSLSPQSGRAQSAPQAAPQVAPQVAPGERTPRAGENKISVSLITAVGSNPAAAAVAMASFVMLVLALFAFMRQREQERMRAVTARDLASLSLDGVVSPIAIAAALPGEARGTALRTRGASSFADWGDAIPRNRTEALHVLGMGARPDAREVALKKVVDGLRLSWHPDHASGPADRQLRELRTKQINAAWDIIRGKRQPT